MAERHWTHKRPVVLYTLTKKTPGDNFGLDLAEERNAASGLYCITHVAKGSLARKAGVQVGFCLLEVNGNNVAGASRDDIRELLYMSPGQLTLLATHPQIYRQLRKQKRYVNGRLPNLIHKSSDDEFRQDRLDILQEQANGPLYAGEDLVEAYDGGLVRSRRPFVCQICLETTQPADGAVLKECLHEFCCECLARVVETTEEPRVRCPYVGSYECQQEMLHHEIAELVTPEVYKQFVGKSVVAAEAVELNHQPEVRPVLIARGGSKPKRAVPRPNERIKRPFVLRDLVQDLETAYAGGLSRPKEEFDCPICLETTKPENGIVLKNCLHQFCRDCLSEHVNHNEGAAVKCPYAGDYTCDIEIAHHEIRELVQDETFDRFLEKGVRAAEGSMPDAFHCKTPDCLGWCIQEAGVDVFDCPLCHQRNCLNCKAIHPTTISCQDYQMTSNSEVANKLSEEAVDRLIAERRAMRCPNCRHVIQKHGGCNNMTCSRCGSGFRWTGIENGGPY